MTALQRNGAVLALALAAIALILPLAVAGTPAMPDYPAHLAGFYLIGGGASRFYSVSWAPLPNLASEIAVPLLAKIMPLQTAAKAFLGAAVAMWVAGPALIHRALYGRVGLAPLASAFFAANANFMFGFFNFYFATGLCLIAFAGWIASGNWPRTLRLTLFALAAIVLFFCHLLAAALLLFLIAFFEAARGRTFWRRSAFDVAVIAIPVAIAYVLRPGARSGELAFHLVDTFPRRVGSLVQRSFDSPAYVAIAALALLFGIGLWRGKITVYRQMRLPLAAIWLLAFLTPESAMGGWGLHLRFPAVAASLLFASCEFSFPRRMAMALGALMLAGFAFLSASLCHAWLGFDRQMRELRAALHDLPRESRLMTVMDLHDKNGVPDQLYWHVAEFGIIDRGDFTSLMFATSGQHIIQSNPEFAPFAARTANEGSPPALKNLEALAANDTNDPAIEKNKLYLRHFDCHYDDVIMIRANSKPDHVPSMLRVRREGSFFVVYAVARPPGCSTISATRP